MTLELLTDRELLDQRLDRPDQTLYLAFFGEFSEASRAARPAFEAFCAAHPEVPAVAIDVGITRGVHKEWGVATVPSVLAVRNGRVLRTVVGAQSAEFYARALLGERGPEATTGSRERAHRVTVYVTDTCPWCTRVKTYLREHKVSFSEINVSRDESAARRMTERSGQMGVPQLDIDGSFVVGFDQPRIDALLGLGRRA
ncbi:MAG: thioredoxin family protein [Deltaproteobacteria bacterium]|nr:thioredoxin family protein [Deltaproteobacteria bacterium]